MWGGARRGWRGGGIGSSATNSYVRLVLRGWRFPVVLAVQCVGLLFLPSWANRTGVVAHSPTVCNMAFFTWEKKRGHDEVDVLDRWPQWANLSTFSAFKKKNPGTWFGTTDYGHTTIMLIYVFEASLLSL